MILTNNPGEQFVEYNIIKHIRNTTFLGFSFIYKINDVLVDLNGATASMTFRENNAEGSELKNITLNSGIIFDIPNSGVQISGFDFDFDVSIIYYDLKIVLAGDINKYPLCGKSNLKENSTE